MLTFVSFLTTLAVYLIIKENIKVFLLRLYPENITATSVRSRSPVKKNIGSASSDSPTADLFSDDSRSDTSN